MERLCDDELSLVLRRLSDPNDLKSFSEVCKKWWKVEALTRSFLRVNGDNPKFLTRLLPRYPNLVNFQAHGRISSLHLEYIGRRYPNLEVIDLKHFMFAGRVGDDGVYALANFCHHLTKVCLSNRGKVRDRGLIALLHSNPNLTHLDLSSCTITDQVLESIALTAPSLQVLNLMNCYGITHLGFLALGNGPMLRRTLKELVIGSDKITDQVLEAIAPMSLQVLDLQYSHGITDSGLVALARGGVSRTLKQLVLEECHKITDKGLEAITVAASSLEDLNLQTCHRITDLGLVGLAAGTLSKTLKKLAISNGKITDYGLSALQRMSCLEDLNFSGCLRVTDAGGVAVSAIGTLTDLDMGFTCITDATLAAVSQNCSNLVLIRLTGCDFITGAGIRSFANHPSLETLFLLSSIPEVSGEDIEYLALRCPSLTFVWLDKSLKVSMTTTMVENISRSCTIVWMGRGGVEF